MIKKITGFSVQYPVTVSMVLFGVLLLGYISFDKLGIDLFPDLNNPRLYIEVKAGERPPEEMEEMFVDRIEAISIRQNGVLNVTSISRVGQSRIEVEYAWEKDMDEAFLDLSKAMATISQNQDIEELNITQYDPNSEPVMLIAFRSKAQSDMDDLRKVASNYIKNELIRLEGIADVEIDGEEELEVVVETNDYLLASYDLTTAEVVNRIKSFNQNVSGGSVVEMGRRYVVKGISKLENLSDVENIIVKMVRPQANNTGITPSPVLLKEVAKVYYQPKERSNIVTIDGQQCLGLSVYKETRYNTVNAVNDLKIALEKMEKALPAYTFTVVQDQGNFISSAIGEVRDSAFLGIILAVFILFLFLRKPGPTIIVSLAIPISIIATFILMYFNGLTLNIMTLGGLALGAGMLVDNAIVVLENIFRNHESGSSAHDAAVNGTSQVGGAIIASTLTTIVVFLPIVYIHGASGELFKDQALTVTFSLLCSLVVAVFMIPMFYVWFYKKRSPFKKGEKQSLQLNGYGRLLDKVLSYRWWVIAGSFVIMFLGWLMLQRVGSEFMPQAQSRDFYVDVKMSEGTRLERTYGAVKSIEQSIKQLGGDDIEMIYAQSGPSRGLAKADKNEFDDQNSAIIKVLMRKNADKNASVLMEQIRGFYPETEFMTVATRQQETALSSIVGSEVRPVVIEIYGEDQDMLEELSTQTMDILRGLPYISNPVSSVEGGAPEIEIVIDRYRAGLMNLGVNEVVRAVNERLEGLNAGQMEIQGELSDITLKLQKTSLNDIKNIRIRVQNMEIPLQEIASVKTSAAPREILHSNQKRMVKLTADKEGEMALDQIATLLREELKPVPFPPEYTYSITGQEAQRTESMESLSFAMIISLLLVYMVLASQFESLVHPFTIILTVPLAIVGAVLVFFIQGNPLNIMAFIGIIMLAGIAVNNSILLVDATIQLRRAGNGLRESIILAGQRRIRPILMTTLTTILALVPLTIGFGESASLRSPMAWAVIGGLTTSTILTLAVIPCFYYVNEKLFRRETASLKEE
jgi:hydrophobic/amphiphilic exporter-1 (mainly G- bacteria), HAE1 family